MGDIDDIDKMLLNLLQENASLPLKALAEQVGISSATTQRRIKALERTGVIERHVAIVDPVKVGHPLLILVMVKMLRSGSPMQHRFERMMAAQERVMSCYEISGDYDFILMVHAKTMQDYHAFTLAYLTADNNVLHFHSQFVMNLVKWTTKISL